MYKYHNEASKTNSLRKRTLKKRLGLPITALFLNIVPILLMLLMSLHLLTDNYIIAYFCFIMALIWMATGFGGLFHLAGIILSILFLCKYGKRTTSIGVVLSVISILFPFVLWFIFIMFEIVDLRMLP